jgi:glycosyltransferase involved in cell wall biosynthesis
VSRQHIGVSEPPPSRVDPGLVSVVVPARDAVATVVEQLDALAAQSYGGRWEVVVVDNRSVDGTAARVGSWAATHGCPASVRVIEASDGSGPGHARNVGVRAARGALLAFCDADDRVTTTWLARLVGALTEADAVVGSSSFSALNPSWLAEGRIAPANRDRPGTPPPEPLFGLVTDTNNLAVRRDAFLAVGGFDEAYQGGSEDKDLGYRLQAAGYRVAAAPDAVVEIRLRRVWSDRVRQAYGRGREDVRLYERFAAAGYPPSGWWDGLRSAGALVLDLRGCHRRAQRVWWWNRAARLAGRVVGSVQRRRLYL